MALSDAELLEQARRGNERSFHELVDRYGDELFRLARALLGHTADAEDTLQETFLGAFQSMRRFEGRSSVRTWLTRILVRQAALRRRKRNRAVAFPDGSSERVRTASAGDPTDAMDLKVDFEAALQRLSLEHREVIMLRQVQGLSYQEIAGVLNVPRGTVESRLHRARGALRILLDDYRP